MTTKQRYAELPPYLKRWVDKHSKNTAIVEGRDLNFKLLVTIAAACEANKGDRSTNSLYNLITHLYESWSINYEGIGLK